MPARTVEVVAPSRLHFGLFALGENHPRRFGGVGVMIERPGLRLRMTASGRLEIRGLLAERVADCVRDWTRWHGLARAPACLLEVLAAPRLHTGLGVGTQLGLAVATALNAAFSRPAASAAELASSVGRGRRSAVGTHGFLCGGLIAERGKLPGEPLSPLAVRLPFPPAWRLVLIEPNAGTGLHGRQEERAFSVLPPVAPQTARDLTAEVYDRMLPALEKERFEEFAESVYRFGCLAGDCFSPVQGGTYASPLQEQLVGRLRAAGIRAVGQSSWGPTLFAITRSPDEAEALVGQLNGWCELAGARVSATPASNQGAQVCIET